MGTSTLKKGPVYAECYGGIWKFSQRNWRNMLRQVALGLEVNYDDYGTMICGNVEQITDLDQEQAEILLKQYA
jgi:hypothetical protein